ncbi:MAG: gamma-glutamylcyclotransferase family protein, partial [Nitriliruptorales bacterium]|nr:gamma-glutamylcyclotransferase family protein [Nitriliruptorales bacterium]
DVEVVGEGEARGDLTTTVFGWPAADFRTDGAVYGTVVRPTDPQAAALLYERCDAIEGVPSLFRRVAVLVDTEQGRSWAAAYEWNHEQGPPPGEPVEGGRWVP